MIKLYSNDCPKCKMIKTILEKKQIEHIVINDIDLIDKLSKENNIMSMPFAEIDNEIIDVLALQKLINNR